MRRLATEALIVLAGAALCFALAATAGLGDSEPSIQPARASGPPLEALPLYGEHPLRR